MTAPTIIYDANNVPIGIRIHATTYSPDALALLVARAHVGQAVMDAARARAAYMAEIAARGCDDLAQLQALRAAWADAERAKRAAIEAALAQETPQ